MAGTISYEKLFPVVPLVGTSIAIFFDVGYFYGVGIDYFTLFSLTEHIGFALEALPVALVISIIFIIVGAITERPSIWHKRQIRTVSEDISRPANERISSLKWQLFLLRIITFLVLLFSASGCVYFWYQGDFRLFLLNAVALLMMIVKVVTDESWHGVEPILLLIIGCAAALLLGEFMGSSYVAGSTALDSIVLKSGETISANVIRSGERGVLYAKPEPNIVEFIQWDAMKSISRNRKKSMFSWKEK